ncbi:MAG: ABC transporter ATP-binding protein [Limisphaerales bacterium]
MSNTPEHHAPLLVATDIHKSYRMGRRSLEVLRGVSLEVHQGNFLAIRGASGAGKSTLLHVLGGLDRPSRGDVTFDGRQLSGFSSSELASFRNRRIGFVFQAYHLLPELTALENACLPARMQRTPHRLAHERATSLLRRVGLGDRLDHRPYELSGGEQQRVALARSLINQPDLLLADEPTGNLDSHTGGEIIALLAELQREYRLTLVIATHDSRVADQAPRIITLVDGVVGD